MRRLILLVIPLLATGMLLFSGLARAGVSVAFTPVAVVYLPAVSRQPTPTPTATATPTATPTQTPTLPPPPYGAVQGSFWREEDKPTYATNIEDIWFWYWIKNNSGARVNYGILGVNVEGPQTFFHTGWSGELAPGGALYIEGGCYGPNGYPCAPDSGAGQQRDKVIVNLPGTYQLKLFICYSSFLACQQVGGAWEQIAPAVQITAIDWTPAAPGAAPAGATPVPADRCRLVTEDPRGIYLNCPRIRK